MPVVRTDGRAYGHVITKFSRMGRLPHFLTHGAPLARFAHQSSAIKVICKSPAFRSCIIYTLFVEIQRHLEIPHVDFCETSVNRRQAPKVYVAQSISKENVYKGRNSI